MTPAQEREYLDSLRQVSDRVTKSLDFLRTKSLSDSQKVVYRQVETLLTQASELRNRDVEAAKSLADRADLLAQDLTREFR